MRFALDVLAILTVVPKIQLQLAESVDVLDEAGSTVSTVGRLHHVTMLVFVSVCRCMHVCEGQGTASGVIHQGIIMFLFDIWNSPSSLGWLASEPQGCIFFFFSQ